MNAVEIEEAVSELARAPFDPLEFPFAFLAAFGNKEATVNRLRSGATNKSDAGGVLQRNNIHLAVAPPGETVETLARLRASPLTGRQKAKFILATDGEQIEAEELGSGETLSCAFAELGDNFGFFLPLAGISTVAEVKNNPIDIKATSRLNKLYVELLKDNADWGTTARRQDLNRFMARLIFCFFAEDTGIFMGDRLFTDTVQQMTEADGSNTAEVLIELFRAMNLDPRKGPRGVRPWADVFPFVNGGLFEEDIGCPRFSRTSRAYLMRAGELDWKTINPDIFGSMIQAVADDDERGELGLHYTSVPNIQKVLDPLFLDDLREQLEAAGMSARKLLNLRKRLSRIRVFDPACGSGNFLVIAYIRMREIEAEIMRRRGEALTRSAIRLTQFYGIEIKSFAAEIARLSLLIAEFQCDVRFIGQKAARALVLPLHATGNIVTGNALRIDWEEVCPPVPMSVEEHDLGGPTGRLALEGGGEAWETYICGNPPYRGSQQQTEDQKKDLIAAFEDISANVRILDYVCGWFAKATRYIEQCQGKAAFVATNSINQGRQVEALWTPLFRKGVRIFFAHSSFPWSNLASHNAGVTVSVVGIEMHAKGVARLFTLADGHIVSRIADNINGYLILGPNLEVQATRRPLFGMPEMLFGNMPNDGGMLILTQGEAHEALYAHNVPDRFLRPFWGSQEFINGVQKHCIWVLPEDSSNAAHNKWLQHRFDQVRRIRLSSDRAATRELAKKPYAFGEVRQIGDETVVLLPRITSERREFLPAGVVPPGGIISSQNFGIYGAPLFVLSILMSRVHRAWVGALCGKLELRLMYSNTICWNTFPVPPLTETNKANLTARAEDILLAREAHFPATIAELYDPEKMPADLRAAHDRNDETLERIYIGRRFRNDTERLEKLFEMYTMMTARKEKTA